MRVASDPNGVPFGCACCDATPASSASDAEIRVGVAGLVRTSDDKLLLTRRSPFLRSFPGALVAPGGHVDPDESLVSAVIRELKEEIGLTLDDRARGSVELVAAWESKFFDNVSDALTHHHVVMYYAIDVETTSLDLVEHLRLQTSEVTGVVFVPLSSLSHGVAFDPVKMPKKRVESDAWHSTRSPLKLDAPYAVRDVADSLALGTEFALERMFE